MNCDFLYQGIASIADTGVRVDLIHTQTISTAALPLTFINVFTINTSIASIADTGVGIKVISTCSSFVANSVVAKVLMLAVCTKVRMVTVASETVYFIHTQFSAYGLTVIVIKDITTASNVERSTQHSSTKSCSSGT